MARRRKRVHDNQSTPTSFLERLAVPEADYRIGTAIKHVGRMKEALITVTLSHQDGVLAAYVAPFPRCAADEIVAEVKVAADGGFAGIPNAMSKRSSD